jgi:aspartate carbamoyltransferase catalytic subunit
MRHLIQPEDLSNQDYMELIEMAAQIQAHPEQYKERAKGKILGSLFFEPSTRTKFSFDSAMLRLGGEVIGFADAQATSSQKGESLADTIRIMSSFTDIIAMRHPLEGASLLASKTSKVPIINGGDGGHQHPTQALTDLYTIYHYKKTLSGHNIALIGDLKYGRTVHSLIKTLARFQVKGFYLVSPEELSMPTHLLDKIENEYPDIEIHILHEMEPAIRACDILYMTRIQKERFFNEADYLKLKNSYLLDVEKMELAKKDAILMHPLPRVNEISVDIDSDPRAVYFEQAAMGMYVRMALILKLLEAKND